MLYSHAKCMKSGIPPHNAAVPSLGPDPAALTAAGGAFWKPGGPEPPVLFYYFFPARFCSAWSHKGPSSGRTWTAFSRLVPAEPTSRCPGGGGIRTRNPEGCWRAASPPLLSSLPRPAAPAGVAVAASRRAGGATIAESRAS